MGSKSRRIGRCRGRWPLGIVLPLALLAAACTSVDERRRLALERAEQLLALGEVERAVTVLERFRDFDPRDAVTTLRLAEIRLGQQRSCDALGLLDGLPVQAPEIDSVPSRRGASSEHEDSPVRGGSRGPGTELERRDRRAVALARALVGCRSWRRAAPVLVALHQRGTAPDGAAEAWLSAEAAAGRWIVPVALPEAWRLLLTEELIRHRHLEAALRSRRLLPSGHPERGALLEKLLLAAVNGARFDFLRTVDEKDAPPETPWKLLARHALLSGSGREDEAALLERRFLERFPEHPRRFEMLLSSARRHVRSGRSEEGLELARRASALRPTRIEPLVEQALALDALGRRHEARRALVAVLGMDPANRAALQLGAEWRRQEEAAEPGPVPGGLRKMEITFEPGSPDG